VSGTPAKMFRELPEWIQDKLRLLSGDGYFYIGRTGAGLTNSFRKECMNLGTLKAIQKHMEYHDLEDRLLVEMIAVEGPRWVSYVRILEYCTNSFYEVLRQKNPSL